jgi:hypothetical protein
MFSLIDIDLVSTNNFLFVLCLFIWLFPTENFPPKWKTKKANFNENQFNESGVRFLFSPDFETFSNMKKHSIDYTIRKTPEERMLLNVIVFRMLHRKTEMLQHLKQWTLDDQSIDFFDVYKRRMPEITFSKVIRLNKVIDSNGDSHVLQPYGFDNGMFAATVRNKSKQITRIFTEHDDVFGRRFHRNGTDKIELEGIPGAFDMNDGGEHDYMNTRLHEHNEFNANNLNEKLRFIRENNDTRKISLYRGTAGNDLEIVTKAPDEFARWAEHLGSHLLFDEESKEYLLLIRETVNLNTLKNEMRNSFWTGQKRLDIFSNYGESDLYPYVFGVMKINRTGSNIEISNILQAALIMRTLVLNQATALLRIVFDKCAVLLKDVWEMDSPDKYQSLLAKTFPHILHNHSKQVYALFEDVKTMMKNTNNPFSFYFAWRLQILLDREKDWLPSTFIPTVDIYEHQHHARDVSILKNNKNRFSCEKRISSNNNKRNSIIDEARKFNAIKVVEFFTENINSKQRAHDKNNKDQQYDEQYEDDEKYYAKQKEEDANVKKREYLKISTDYLSVRAENYPPSYNVVYYDDGDSDEARLAAAKRKNSSSIVDHKFFFDIPNNFDKHEIYKTHGTYTGKRDHKMKLFEYAVGHSLRTNQVESVKRILKEILDTNAGIDKINQLLMGSGKTSVIIPLVVLNLAGLRSFTTVIVPENLMLQTYGNLIVLNSILPPSIPLLRVPKTTREKPLTSAFYFENLAGTMSTILLISDNELKRTYLHKPVLEKIKNSSNLSIFENSNFLIVDEFDSVMDPTSSTMNYPILPATHNELGLSSGLLDTILQICANFVFDKHNSADDNMLFSQKMIEMYIKSLTDNRCFLIAEHIFIVMNSIFTSFVYNREYGASKTNPEQIKATPYARANTPIEDSNFASTDIDVITTILLNLQRPFDVHISTMIFEKMRETHTMLSNTTNEHVLHSICDIFDIDHSVAVLVFFATDKLDGINLLLAFLISTSKEKQKHIKIKFIREIVLKYITSTAFVQTISGYDIINKFNNRMVGLSGTGANFLFPKLSLDDGTSTSPISQTDKTYEAFIEAIKNNDKPKFASSQLKIISLVKDVLIDAAALFLGISNHEVAKSISKHFNEIPVVFFNNGQQMIIDNSLSLPKILQTIPKNAKIFFDQSHCIGIDLKHQNKNWDALVTFDPETTKYAQISQAVFRMRHLPQQTITFVSKNKQFNNIEKIAQKLLENQVVFDDGEYRDASIIQNVYTALNYEVIEKFNIYKFFADGFKGNIFNYLLLLIEKQIDQRKSSKTHLLSILHATIKRKIKTDQKFKNLLMKQTETSISNTKVTNINAKSIEVHSFDNDCINLRERLLDTKKFKFSSLMKSVGIYFSKNFDILNYLHDGTNNSQYSYLFSSFYDTGADGGEVLVKPFGRQSLPFIKLDKQFKIKVLGEKDVMALKSEFPKKNVLYDHVVLDFISGKTISLEIFINVTLPSLKRLFHLDEIMYIISCLEQCFCTKFCNVNLVVLYFEFDQHQKFINFVKNNICGVFFDNTKECDEKIIALFEKILK